MPRGGRGGSRQAGERRRRRGLSRRKAIMRGESRAAMVNWDWEREGRGLKSMNRGKRGGQFTVTSMLVAALAALKHSGGMSYLELQGYARRTAGGRCAITAPQPQGRTAALPVGAVAGGVLVGDARVRLGRRRDGTLVPAPRRRGAGGITAARRDGMVLVGFGPGAGPEDCALADPAWLPGRRRSAGRPGKCGRSVGVRGNHKPAILMGARTRRTLAAATGDSSVGDASALLPCAGEAVHAGSLRGRRGRWARTVGDGAHGSRKSPVGCRRVGVRPVAPIRVNDSGRARGAPCWRGEASLRPGGVRDARGFRPGPVPIETRRLFREIWKLVVGYGVRAPGGAEVPASRRLYGGDVMAVSPANVIHEIVGKLAIHNALLEAAGSA